MKKGVSSFLVVFLLVLLPISLVSAQYAQHRQIKTYRSVPSGAAHIVMTMLNQDPDPVWPGQVVEIRFKVENSGDETFEDVKIELLVDYPFTIYQSSSVQNIGKMQGAQTGSDASIVEYKLKVEDSVAEGENELELKVWIGDNVVGVYNENEFLVDIETQDAIVSVKNVTFTPDPVEPGGESKMKVKIRNEADSLIQTVRLNLDLNLVPLTPASGSNEQEIFRLISGAEHEFNFKLKALPQASGIYNVPAKLSYYDEIGKNYTRDLLFGVTINKKPRVEASIRDTDIRSAGNKGAITIEFANPQEIDVRFLEARLLPHPSYRLLSKTRYIYLGDLESDDTTTETFEIYSSEDAKELVIPLEMVYKDALNKKYTSERQLTLLLYTKSELKKFGIEKPSYLYLYLIILLFAGAGYLFWRKRKNAL